MIYHILKAMYCGNVLQISSHALWSIGARNSNRAPSSRIHSSLDPAKAKLIVGRLSEVGKENIFVKIIPII